MTDAEVTELLQRRFSPAAIEQIGKIAASLWVGGIQGLHAQGIPVSIGTQAALAPTAMKLILGQASGLDFMLAIGSHMDGEGEFGRFMAALETWYRREHGQGPGSGVHSRATLGATLGSGAHSLAPDAGMRDMRTEVIPLSELHESPDGIAIEDIKTEIIGAEAWGSAPDVSGQDRLAPSAAPPTAAPPTAAAAAPPTAAAGAPLSQIAGFEILELLGEGGMGRVFKARQQSLDRFVALKVLNPLLAQDESFGLKLEAEAKAAAKLRHPNIVGVIELGTCSQTGVTFVAFEYVDGQPASAFLAESGGTLPEADALTLCLGIAEGLSCAEDAGIVHRDVKPDNILIGANGIPMLADLGLAKRTDTPDDDTPGVFMGTPHYASPEQALGVDQVDVRTDLYALGICLFQFLTGTLPFPAKTSIAILTRHISEDVPDPRTVNSDLSKEVAQLVSILCARARKDRYRTARDAADNIQRVLEGTPPFFPGGEGRQVKRRQKTTTGVRSGPSSLSGSRRFSKEKLEQEAHEEALPETEADEARTFAARGRGFYDDIMAPDEDDSGELQKVQKTGGKGYYDDLLMGKNQDLYGKQGSSESSEDASVADVPPSPDPDASMAALGSQEMLLSDDGERAYQMTRLLGSGSQALVHEAEIMGEAVFDGFQHPVRAVAIKLAKATHSLKHEQKIYEQQDPRIVRLLDWGTIQGDDPYLVLEKLEKHPHDRFAKEGRGAQVDPATAVESFMALVGSLKGLHFRRKSPLVLCSITPASIMLRMGSVSGEIETEAYMERLSKGRYEPVFIDLGTAQDRQELLAREGALESGITDGDPLYLPPESLPKRKRAPRGGVYGPPTDVYALMLTFCTWLTGDAPYVREKLDPTASSYLKDVFELKKKRVKPYNPTHVRKAAGSVAEDLLQVIEAALNADPARRAKPGGLLRQFKKLFDAQDVPKPDVDYHYDDPDNSIRLRQAFYPRLNPSRNLYM